VDWAVPVREIATQLHVSRQRVYQVMAERGIPRRRRWGIRRAQLTGLDTTRLTVAQAAARVGCSAEYARAVLRAAGKPYRLAGRDPQVARRYLGFRAWLRTRYRYGPGTIQTLCTRCRRVEREHHLRLDQVLARPDGLAQVYRRLTTDPARGTGTPRAALNNDRLAMRRYAEFRAAARDRGDQ
jgi:hypothetical protein